MRYRFGAAVVYVCLVASSARAEFKTLKNEEAVIAAHKMDIFTFRLAKAGKLTLVVTGKKDAGKGFNVYLVAGTDELNKMRLNQSFRQVEAFHGLKVMKMDASEDVQPGEYVLVVENSENMMKSMEAVICLTAVFPDPPAPDGGTQAQ